MYVFVYVVTITCLIMNMDARSVEVKEGETGYKRKSQFQRDISEVNATADMYDKACKCENGICQKDDKGLTVCQCLPEWGLLTPTKCGRCNCGKGVSCSFNRSWFKDEKKCFCKDGYKDVGGLCKGSCSPNPCLNGGTCDLNNDQVSCLCKALFIGEYCEKDNSFPTTEASSVEAISPSFLSTTKEEGTRSKELWTEHTFSDPSTSSAVTTGEENGSTTVGVPSTVSRLKLSTLNATSTKRYSKEHSAGTGETGSTTMFPTTIGPSTTDTDPCATNPCQNGGICREVSGKVKCYCVAPFEGEFCEKDPCYLNPCMNGGHCKVRGNSFTCICSPPYSGKLCEKDPCSENPCQNGGTCFIKGGSFECRCREPFAGALCDADPCDWNPCKNGGVCKILNEAVKCFCMEPYTGEFCKSRAEIDGYFIPFAVVSALLFFVLISACCILLQR